MGFQIDPPPSRALDLSGYDEVWVIARRSAEASAPREADERRPVGLIAKGKDGEGLAFPLVGTQVSADVDGVVQSVLVTQTYENPFDAILEATYVFPLPHDSAVCDFVMTIGARRIRGIVRDREEAERVYSEAQAEGHVASLLTQERPNVFTQRVANLEPGKSIDVELRYFGVVAQRDGWFELVVPTVVGPRYNPAGRRDGVGAVARGDGGASGQRAEVQYLASGEKTTHELLVAVDLDAGAALEEVLCPTHRIESEWLAPGRRVVRLADGTTAADRDFVLRWRVAGREVKTAFLQHEDGDGRWFSLVLHPPADLADLPRAPMEMVFVIDCSGSMAGEPLRACKRAARRVMERLTPRDRFQVVQFSATASLLGKEPIAATRENLRLGMDYLDSLESEGGTEMIHGIRAALDARRDPARQRVVTFMTDGFIGNESEILGEIAARLGDTRIFSFGAGTSVNRYLLESMARMGRGAVAYVGPDGGASDAEVDAFYERISHPAIADVEIDWGMTVMDVFPTRVPDLFVGRPVVLTGRIEGRVAREVTVRGTVGGEPASYRVEIPEGDEASRPALPKVWARAKIEQLEQLALARGEDMTPQVRAVAVEHGLMSRVTAFVAVDSLTRVGTGPTVAVAQPVPLPAGVSHATTLRQ